MGAKIWRVRADIPREGNYVKPEWSIKMSRADADRLQSSMHDSGIRATIESIPVEEHPLTLPEHQTKLKMVKRDPVKGEYLICTIGSLNIVINAKVQVDYVELADKVSAVLLRMLRAKKWHTSSSASRRTTSKNPPTPSRSGK